MAKFYRRPNGSGSICKLSGNRRKPWVVFAPAELDYEKGNTKRLLIGTFKTISEAEYALANYDPIKQKNKKLSFKDVYEKWWAEHSERVTENTKKSYFAMYNKHLSKLDNLNFIEINNDTLQNFIKEMDSPSSQRLVKAILKEIYKYALRKDIVIKDYSNYLILKKVQKKIDRKIFTDSEIQKLLDYDDVTSKAILILIYTGIRISELLNLTKEDINNDCIRIVKSKTKAGRNRIIPIHCKIEKYIKQMLEENSIYLYNKNGYKVSYDDFRKNFNIIMLNLNMEHTIHDTRHTFATLLDRVGANKNATRKMLGHANNEVTDRFYIHKDIEELKEAINLIQ